MPGANFSVYGCSTSRENVGVGIFKLPNPSRSEFYRNREILNEITKGRQIDEAFRNRIKKNQVYICERHFLPGEIYECK